VKSSESSSHWQLKLQGTSSNAGTGGGTAAGTVTLSAGPGNSCVATLTAGNGSRALDFPAARYFAITASYTPVNGNHLARTGSDALVVFTTPSSTDLRVRIGNGVRNIGAGQTVR